MGEDLKTELGVLIDHVQSTRRVLAGVLLDKVRILQKPLEIGSHLLAALRSWVTGKDGTAIRYELIELIGHGAYSFESVSPSFAHSRARRQRH